MPRILGSAKSQRFDRTASVDDAPGAAVGRERGIKRGEGAIAQPRPARSGGGAPLEQPELEIERDVGVEEGPSNS